MAIPTFSVGLENHSRANKDPECHHFEGAVSRSELVCSCGFGFSLGPPLPGSFRVKAFRS